LWVSATIDTLTGQLQVAVAPLLVSPGLLFLGAWAFPFALVLSLASFARWKLMLYAGLVGILSGAFWIAGLMIAPIHLGQDAVPQIGAYVCIFAGALLFVGYFLTKADKIGAPLD
jgi:hypothetical protein